MSPKRVLFVDDESKVLSGLRRMLSRHRRQWEMKFVESGSAALELLERERFDVLISDMRMPGMNGAQLLSEVKRRYPSTVRIVLSGHSEREQVFQTVGVAHQFLSKPCDPQVLQSTISRAVELRDHLGDQSIRDLVASVDNLPSVPGLYTRLTNELQSEDASITKIADIVSQDVAMTAKILQIVNSSFFGFAQPVSHIRKAVALLGVNSIRSLVLTAHVFGSYDGQSRPSLSVEKLVSHSLQSGMTSHRIASYVSDNETLQEESYVAGLLHDVGALVLSAGTPNEYEQAIELAQRERIALCEAERLQFGATHAQVGGFLLELWGFPVPIVEAVTFHDSPSSVGHREFSPLTAVHVADRLTEGPLDVSHHDEIDIDYLREVGVDEHIPQWESELSALV